MFYETYHRILKSITLNEALGGGAGAPPTPDAGGEPTGKQEGPAGSDPNPQGPQPDAQQNQTPVDPFEMTFANFVLGLSKLTDRDQNVVNLPVEQIELNLSKSGSNPNLVKKFLQSILKRFGSMVGTDTKQLNYNDPKFGSKLGTAQQALEWANGIVNVLKLVKNKKATSNVELGSYTEITSENLDNFKKALLSLSGAK